VTRDVQGHAKVEMRAANERPALHRAAKSINHISKLAARQRLITERAGRPEAMVNDVAGEPLLSSAQVERSSKRNNFPRPFKHAPLVDVISISPLAEPVSTVASVLEDDHTLLVDQFKVEQQLDENFASGLFHFYGAPTFAHLTPCLCNRNGISAHATAAGDDEVIRPD
jgi:hypothetical protein